MMNCQNCGKANTPETIFCRFCGTKFTQTQPLAQVTEPYNHNSPRPYAWQTDEFQTNSQARKTASGIDQPSAFSSLGQEFKKAPLAYAQPQHFAQSFRCPNCMSAFPPKLEKKISTAGWITFAALLIFFFPLFWIGLLIKEDVVTCQSCNVRLNN